MLGIGTGRAFESPVNEKERQEKMTVAKDDLLRQQVEAAWDKRAELSVSSSGEARQAVDTVLKMLDSGRMRVAEKQADGAWQVHEWLKKAVLLSFRLNDMQLIGGGPSMGGAEAAWFDKVPSKFQGWGESSFRDAGFRAVPGSFVRRSAYIAPDAVLMPCFVNVGAWIGEGTMIDSWATVGSCAQIGAHCHISGGVGIGGVLEPLQASPVIIEDNCFIGARSEVAEGVIIEEGAVISMGVYLGASTKIVDRETGAIHRGRVPAYSVVVPGSLPGKNPGDPALNCGVIVKKVDAQTRAKTGINELLRAA